MYLSMTVSSQARFWLEYSQQLSTSIRYTEALKAAEKATTLAPAWAEAWYVRGTCQAMLAQYEPALASFQRSLELDDQNASSWDALSWVLGILGRTAEALKANNKALALDPEHMAALKRRERLLGPDATS